MTPSECDELVQTTILRIYEHLDKAPLDDERSFLRWCVIIQRNIYVDSLRRKRRVELERGFYEEEQARQPESAQGDRIFQALSALMDKISYADREVLYALSQDKTISEIAAEKGLSKSTLHRRVQSIMKQLQEGLAADHDLKRKVRR